MWRHRAAAARAVGPAGAVYGIDLSEPMLDVARRRAETSEPSNITLVQGDVQTHRFPTRSDVAATGPGRAVLDAMPTDRCPAALDAVRAALADHIVSEGVQLGAAIWIVTASAPA